jgi:hypothetical protein
MRSCFCLLAVVFLAGCGLFGTAGREASPTTPYPALPDALDESYMHSPSGDIAARYPTGWLHVDIHTIPMENVLEVYTDQARERAVVLAEIPATAEFRRMVERDGMNALSEESFRRKSAKAPHELMITRPSMLYTVKGKLFVSYDYADMFVDSTKRREHSVVLFTTGARFYELSIIELVPPQDAGQHIQNFRLLQSVVASLEGAAEVRGANAASSADTY